MAEYGDPADWHTRESMRTPTDPDSGDAAIWEEADSIPDGLLDDLLFVARDAVLAFAPALPADYPAGKCPTAYRLAHMMQTRNLWNAVEVDAGGDMGGGDYMIRPVPLDWMIKQVLRPRTAIPVAL